MKRVFALLLAFALLLPAGAFALDKRVSAYRPTDMCMFGEGRFCFAAPDLLALYENGAVTAEIACEGAKLCDYLDGSVYVLRPKDGNASVTRYGDGFAEEETYDLGWCGEIVEFAVNGTYICWIVQDPMTHLTCLCYYDPLTGETETHDEYAWVNGLAADGERIAFQYDDGLWRHLAVHTPEDGNVATWVENPPEGEVLLRPGEKAFSVLTRDAIEYIGVTDKDSSQKSRGVPGLEYSSYLADTDSKGLYIFDPERNELRFVAYTSMTDSAGKTLTIASLYNMSTDHYLQRVKQYFLTLYPECSLEYYVYPSVEQMRLDLLSGASKVDLLVMTQAIYAEIVRSGVFADLRSFEPIRALEESDEFLRWPFHLVESGEGALYLMPEYSDGVEIWEPNLRLFERLGLELPREGWTWDDYIELARRARAIDETVYPLYCGHISNLYDQYAYWYVDVFTGEVNFDTDLFRHLLTLSKALYDEGMLYLDGPEMNDWKQSYLFYPWGALRTGEYSVGKTLVYPPLLEEGMEPALNFDGMLFGIYSASDDKVLAAQYISAHYRYPIDETRPDYRIDTAYPLLYTDPAINMRANGRGIHCVSEEQVSVAISYFEHVKPLDNLVRMQNVIYEPAMQYVEGKKSIDSAVKEIQRAFDMRMNE